jgi:hypothetical protein
VRCLFDLKCLRVAEHGSLCWLHSGVRMVLWHGGVPHTLVVKHECIHMDIAAIEKP